MKKLLKFGAFLIIILAFNAVIFTDFNKIYSLPNTAFVSRQDIETLNLDKTFGKFCQVSLSHLKVSNQKKSSAKMWVKLFGIIPLRQIEVEFSDGEEVFLGGTPLGFSLKTDGLLVVGTNTVNQEIQTKPTIQKGDFLTHINGINLSCPEDVGLILEKFYSDQAVDVTINRNGEIFTQKVSPQLDPTSHLPKLGLWVKDNSAGIGTLTFVRTENNHFGALGHAICDYETGCLVPAKSGNVYKCSMVGITKAEKNLPGELRCVFLEGINQKGTIEKNTNCGVFGKLTDISSIVDNNLIAEIGSRLVIKTGKAKIVSAVSGVLEEYDIEIIKTYYQPESDDKSFVFRVTDKRLLEKTGGIVQGMSGSPIVQNGKLIGATTHVFVSDPTKGYGIYADWMAEQ